MELSHLIIIAGFILLLANSVGRRRSRQSRKPGSKLLGWWLRWGDFIALGMVLAGMLRLKT